MSAREAAVLFDMDGVLVHSREAWFRLMEECGRVFRGTPITREEFTPTFGQSTREDVEVFGLGCTVEELDRFYAENFRCFTREVVVNPDARPVLEMLRGQGRALAVVTNTATSLASDILEDAGLRGLFDFIACSDQVTRPKPAPDLVLHALEALGHPAASACMVGDSRFDRSAARAAGVRFIGLGLEGDIRIERLTSLEEVLGPRG
jgi:phosphoglycolate phosphatase/AHBA synthesis associated protein